MRRIVLVVALVVVPACSGPVPSANGVAAPKNVAFTGPVEVRGPTFAAVPLPDVRGGAAVWGGTGRDHRGRIYLGVCCEGVPEPSAHLVEYDPVGGTSTDRGGVLENLRRLGLAVPGEGQQKIHTKIVQAADGFLYFASMDEGGENEDGSKLPTFGSHLWRVRADGSGEWEHIAAVREAVIAAAVGGRFVYYLAYFGHVLFRYEPATGAVRRLTVGSHGGHISRNLIADDRGHVFVPRVTAAGAELVEFDEKLAEVALTKLQDYATTPDASSHGITGVAELADGGRAFVTDSGRAYRIDAGQVTELGRLHPGGTAYLPCLFSPDGATQLVALGYRSAVERQYDWVVFDLASRSGRAVPVAPPVPVPGWTDLLLYGSVTRDDAGRFYVGGRYMADRNRSIPVVWAITP